MAIQFTSNFAICDNCFNHGTCIYLICLHVRLSTCVPVCLIVYLPDCLSACLFARVHLSVCLSVYMSVYLAICLLLLVFEIFFLLLYQDPQYVSVGSNGQAITHQELKQVGIVTFWRCFVTFCVSGIVWTFSLKLTYIYFYSGYLW